MKLIFAVVCVLFSMTTLAAPKSSSPGKIAIARAEKIASERLKDPSSVQFERVVYVPDTRTVCGKYNAKNSYGGYVGFRFFAVDENGRFYDFHFASEGSTVPELQAIMSENKTLATLCAHSGL